MTTKIRPRTLAVLVAFLALLGVVAVTIPSSGAAEASVVRLNLGSDGRYFEYGAARQNLATASNGCQITSPENIIDLSSTPVVTPASKSSLPGLGADGIGVKQSNSSGNGTPCSQVESVESLILAPSTATDSVLAGRRFTGIRLDLEMTGNAVVKLTFSGGATQPSVTYTLQTGTAISPAEFTEADKTAPYIVSSSDTDRTDACAAPNSSGPNSGSNDNCQWGVTPKDTFQTITLTTSQGTVSLEGGGDFPTGSDNDSLFYLANADPTATNDVYTTDEDTTLTGDVTDNDTDPDGEALNNATITSAPAHGVLTLASNGTFSYDPAPNYNGPDSFTYTVKDASGATSNPATVGITVDPVNDAPEATGNAVSIEEGGTGTVDVADDLDTNDTLTVVCTEPAGWDIVDLGGGEVRITPPAEFVGERTISCTVTDEDGATTESPVTIAVGVTNVNDAPVGVDDAEDILANAPSVVIHVLDNDTDVDSAALSVTDIANITPAGATAVANADGTITYSPPTFNPARDFTSPGSFTYKAVDSGGLESGVTTVTINPIICSQDEVTDTDGDVTGSFTRIGDPFACKQFTLEASTSADTILFKPSGSGTVSYRGVLEFGPESAPAAGGTGEYSLLLRYDPDDEGPQIIKPVKWCINPQFDASNLVISATLPGGESWCVASGYTKGGGTLANPQIITVWQVFGQDDPKFLR